MEPRNIKTLQYIKYAIHDLKHKYFTNFVCTFSNKEPANV